MDPTLFATAAKGTEGALRDELRELRFRGVRADRGGVHFGGDLAEGYRACLELRTALRVLLRLHEFEASDGQALYEGARAVEWGEHLTSRQTLAVRASCRSSSLTHTQYIAQKTKDAIVDRIRDETGSRPDVDRDDPDVLVSVHLVKDRATLYLDLAGESLHKRGYRMDRGEAPLKETLAAAMLRLGGWDRRRPLVDPMCGAGTIAIEAALWASDVAPGLSRGKFGFERWASHDAAAAKRIAALRGIAKERGRPSDAKLVTASDVDLPSLSQVAENARRAGVAITTRRQSIRDLAPMSPVGHVITNPPYDERLAAAPGLYRDMGRAFERLHGHRITVLAGTPEIPRSIRLQPSSSLTVFNGDIECRLLTYDVE
jgi:23S rRNA (guanine2445-N2)-methyltransferase